MPAWLLPAITGILGAAGTIFTNKANRAMSREQMAFQERMSSTAAQRSTQDYRDAGLNPALAYGNTASTPGGSTAQLSDAAASGISNANQARALQQQLRIAEEQNQADLALKREQAGAAKAANAAGTSQANSTWEDTRLKRQAFEFNTKLQPADVRLRTANALAAEYGNVGLKNEAEWNQLLGKVAPALSTAKTLTGLMSPFGGLMKKAPIINRTINPTKVIIPRR